MKRITTTKVNLPISETNLFTEVMKFLINRAKIPIIVEADIILNF